jgi:dihydrofolate reductase
MGFNNVITCIDYFKKSNYKQIFIIGGQKLYSSTLDYVDNIYLTRIDCNLNGDVYYPEIDKTKFKLIDDLRYEKDDKNCYSMNFQKYEKIL